MPKKKKARSSKRTAKPRRDHYQEVTDRMVAALKAGTVPWRRSWKSGANGMPRNLESGKAYRGINVMSLWLTAMERGYSTSEWGTFRQTKEAAVKAARAAGRTIEERADGNRKSYWDADNECYFAGGVRKGEKGTPIVFWSRKEIEEKGETKEIWWMRSYTVFNADQCEGLSEEREPLELVGEAEEIASAWLEAEEIELVAGNPAYSPSSDHIRMPAAEAFDGAGEYHCAMFHEIVHSTGHRDRLDRLAKDFKFGDHAYSKEELVAEVGAAFLCAATGIEDTRVQENSAAYLAHWVAALEGDAKLLISAAQQAQKAADLVLASVVASAA